MSTKSAGVFLICLDLKLFTKIKKTCFLHIRFLFLLITPDLDKIKKIPDILFETLVSRKRVQSFSKKKLNSMVVGVRQSFENIENIKKTKTFLKY